MAFVRALQVLIGAAILVQLGHAARPDNTFHRRHVRPVWKHEPHPQHAYKHFKRNDNTTTKYKFLTEKTTKFAVDGKALPDVDFDLGESYAGLLPISNKPNETSQLFFWFWPSIQPNASKEIVIWLNGGPGCSSLLGLIGENGPFTWLDGTYKPTKNSYDWRNLTNVVWIEQPVGTGFTQGNVTIKNETDLAGQFIGFYNNFMKTFDLEGYDLYILGESYAGVYIPWIADRFISSSKCKGYGPCTDYKLKGVGINDPVFGDDASSLSLTYKDYWFFYQHLYGFNTSTLVNLTARHIACEYDKYLDKYFTFPPPQEPFPILPTPFSANPQIDKCDTYGLMFYAAKYINPCFNQYRINDHCPHPWSIIGPVNQGDYNPAPKTIYFNRSDVQIAINAPKVSWEACSSDPVFAFNNSDVYLSDPTPPIAQTQVLTRVIEATNNVMVGHGYLDSRVNFNGTLLSLQNISWNGFQGFKEYPASQPFYVPYDRHWNRGSQAGAGVVGSWGSERGLTFYTVTYSGHMLPGDAPGAAFRMLEKLLGRIENLAQRGTFTTQMDIAETKNWTGGFLFKEDEGPPIYDPYVVEKMVRDQNITLFPPNKTVPMVRWME